MQARKIVRNEAGKTETKKKLARLVNLDDQKAVKNFLSTTKISLNFNIKKKLRYYEDYEYLYESSPLIFLCKSPKMVSLLLKYGASPFEKGAYDAYKEKQLSYNMMEKDHLRSGKYSILESFARDGLFSNIVTLIKNKSLVFKNNKINEVILYMFRVYSDFYRDNNTEVSVSDSDKKFYFDAIKLLIQSSTDLQASVYPLYNYSYRQDSQQSPFNYALQQFKFVYPTTHCMSLLLENNFQLVKNLNIKSPFFWPQEKENFDKTFNLTHFNQFFDFIRIWELLKIGMTEKQNLLFIVPVEILRLIMKNIFMLHCKVIKITPEMISFIQENTLLTQKMHQFKELYEIAKNKAPWYTKHDFWQKNCNLYPVTFFAKARQHQVTEPAGLTAQTLAKMQTATIYKLKI